jgi:hypothetical protein
MKTKTFLAAALLAGLAFTTHAEDVTPAEARVIAKEAYIYGEPIVDNYRVQYAYFALMLPSASSLTVLSSKSKADQHDLVTDLVLGDGLARTLCHGKI